MQKRRSYWTVSSLCVLAVLSACGEEEDGTTNTATGGNEGEQSQESNTPVEEDGYSEYAEIAVEGYVSDPVFYISGNGETVLWAEQPGELTQIEGSKVWVDGETKEADIPERDPAIQPMLSESGMIVYSHSDRDRPVEERNWVGELNPLQGNEQNFIWVMIGTNTL